MLATIRITWKKSCFRWKKKAPEKKFRRQNILSSYVLSFYLYQSMYITVDVVLTLESFGIVGRHREKQHRMNENIAFRQHCLCQLKLSTSFSKPICPFFVCFELTLLVFIQMCCMYRVCSKIMQKISTLHFTSRDQYRLYTALHINLFRLNWTRENERMGELRKRKTRQINIEQVSLHLI